MMVVTFAVAMYEWAQMVKNLSRAPLWVVFGLLYIGQGFFSFYIIQKELDYHIFPVIITVWASDIGAYLFGKIIGGAKMIPKISPNKTWAGLVGAIILPYAFMVIAYYLKIDFLQMKAFTLYTPYILVAIVIGVFGQIGDLLISFIKRKANLKDTGNLIPGHGGLLDRIDALILVSPVLIITMIISFIMVCGITGYGCE